MFSALGMDWIEPKDRKGVGPASHIQQEALLQHQAIPMAEASLWSLGLSNQRSHSSTPFYWKSGTGDDDVNERETWGWGDDFRQQNG